MKKLIKFFALTLSVIVLAFSLTACEGASERLARIVAIKPEVSYGYTVIGGNSLTIDCKIYNYGDLAYKLVKKREKDTYPYEQRWTDNYVYFFYQYDSRGKVKYKNFEPYKNEKTFDVGLFRVNIKTAKCELVYDFKNVYPTSVDELEDPYVGSVVDENRAVLQYNGTISILNLNTLKITDSIDVYDKDQFINAEEFPYYITAFYDFAKLCSDGLYYYELDGYSFKLHKFENSGGEYINRWENYIYTYNDGSGWVDCYDLATDERVEEDELSKKMEDANNKEYEEEYQNSPEKDAYVINGKKYYLDLDDELTIYNEGEYIRNENNEIELNKNREVLCTINEEYLKENSQVFNDLYYLWDKNPREYEVDGFGVIDGKLFVAVSAGYLLVARTPSYIFECDIENNKVYYVGFIDNENRYYVCDLRLH